MKNRKGFTLMEILAVLLVIAVIASFAVPVVKSVRREMRYQKAKVAGMQLAEAVRSFYTDTKGCLAIDEEGFYAPDAAEATVCPANHTITTGVPGNCESNLKARIVFACNYISPKMFIDLPYTFRVYDPRVYSTMGTFIEGDEEGSERKFFINRDMTINEDED